MKIIGNRNITPEVVNNLYFQIYDKLIYENNRQKLFLIKRKYIKKITMFLRNKPVNALKNLSINELLNFYNELLNFKNEINR